MAARNTTVVLAILAVLVALVGCGSRTAQDHAATIGTDPTPRNGTSPSPPPPAPDPTTTAPSPASPSDRSHAEGIVTESTTPAFAVVDQASGDYVIGQGKATVLLEIGIHGVGQAWTVDHMQVRQTDRGTTVEYDGHGKLDRKARFDRRFPALAEPSPANPESAHLHVELVMTPDGLGHADVWIDGGRHRVEGTEAPHTADPVVSSVVEAMRAENWSAMYDLTVHLPGMTRRGFVGTFGTDGSIHSLEPTGDTVYRVEGGVAYSDTPAHVDATIEGHHLDRDVAVELVYQDGEWRFSSLAKGMHGN
jgi:hypothetical protein